MKLLLLFWFNVALCKYLYAPVKDSLKKCQKQYCLIFYQDPREPQSLQFQKLLENNEKMMSQKYQQLDVIVAMMSRYSDDDSVYQSHVQHPYIELYHQRGLQSSLSNIHNLTQVLQFIQHFLNKNHLKTFSNVKRYTLLQESDLIPYIGKTPIFVLSKNETIDYLMQTFEQYPLTIFQSGNDSYVITLENQKFTLGEDQQNINLLLRQYIYPKVLQPSNPHFNSYLRGIQSNIIIYFQNDHSLRYQFQTLLKEQQSKHHQGILCYFHECEALQYHLGIENEMFPIILLVDSLNKKNKDIKRLNETFFDLTSLIQTQQEWVYDRKTKDIITQSKQIEDYWQFQNLQSLSVDIKDIDQAEYDLIFKMKEKVNNFYRKIIILIYTTDINHCKQCRISEHILINLVKHIKDEYQITIEIGRINIRKFDKHLNVYLREEDDVLYNIHSPEYRDFAPLTLPITNLDCKTLYYELQKSLGNPLEKTTPTLLSQILKVIQLYYISKPSAFFHDKPKHDEILFAQEYSVHKKTHLSTVNLDHDDL